MQDQLKSLPKKVREHQKAHRNFFIKLRKKTPKISMQLWRNCTTMSLKNQIVSNVLIVAKPPVQFLRRRIFSASQNLLELKHGNL